MHRCPQGAEFAVSGTAGTVLACKDHLYDAMNDIENRDGIGVFWRSNGQCFRDVKPAVIPAVVTGVSRA